MLDILSPTLPQRATPEPAKLAYTIPEASQVSGLGRTTIYALIGTGELTAIKIGNRTLITAESLRQLIENAPRAEIRPAHRRGSASQ